MSPFFSRPFQERPEAVREERSLLSSSNDFISSSFSLLPHVNIVNNYFIPRLTSLRKSIETFMNKLPLKIRMQKVRHTDRRTSHSSSWYRDILLLYSSQTHLEGKLSFVVEHILISLYAKEQESQTLWRHSSQAVLDFKSTSRTQLEWPNRSVNPVKRMTTWATYFSYNCRSNASLVTPRKVFEQLLEVNWPKSNKQVINCLIDWSVHDKQVDTSSCNGFVCQRSLLSFPRVFLH